MTIYRNSNGYVPIDSDSPSPEPPHDFYPAGCDPTDKAPHQSEVHIGERYVLLSASDPKVLMQKVEDYLSKGFRLYGNPWTGPDEGHCSNLHYQAMVRGI